MRGSPSTVVRVFVAAAAALSLAWTPALAGSARDAGLPQRSDDASGASARFDSADDEAANPAYFDAPVQAPKPASRVKVRYLQDADEDASVEPEAVCRYTTNELIVIYTGLVFAFIPGIVAAHLLC